MHHLDTHSEIVDGVEAIRDRLQQLMDDAMTSLAGTHFELAEPIKAVEARIAPPGSAAAPYYTVPSQDFSRPGRTWLPTLGKTTFPLWILISTWYHEGVPGHHMQLAQWQYLSKQLSMYQTGLGSVSACSEGWALYAERLMDELGYLEPPGARMGYLDAQLMRAIRVIVDIGMHLRAADRCRLGCRAPGSGGRRSWRLSSSSRTAAGGRDFLASEIVRYLGLPGQAISYKLGERAWLAGRDAARAAHGASFDLKSWHMAALSLGALGLDDLDGGTGAAVTVRLGRAGRAFRGALAQVLAYQRAELAGLPAVDQRAGRGPGQQRRQRQRALARLGQQPSLQPAPQRRA